MSLKQALQIFLDCPDWRRFVHDQDCCSPGDNSEHPDDRLCTCDGPYNVEVIEAAARKAGLKLHDE